MKRSKLSLGLILLGGLALTGCNSTSETSTSVSWIGPTQSESNTSSSTTSITEQTINYKLKVIDLDGEVLLDKNLTTTKSDSLFLDLNRESRLESEASDLGHEIIAINDSIKDSNYSFKIYKNDVLVNTEIDEISLSNNDKITIKNECKTSLDDTDKLVDKAFYQYIKNYLIEDVKDDTLESLHMDNGYGGYTNFTNYWTYMVIGLLKDNSFSINIKNDNQTLYNAIKDYDLTTLSGVDYGKYYYYAKAFDIDLTSYRTHYTAFINDELASDYYSWGEYEIPFEIAPAKKLNIESDKINSIINSTYVPDTTYDTDGANWKFITDTLFGKTVSNSYLEDISTYDYSMCYGPVTSTALSIASFASANVNVRGNEYKNNNKDLLESLMENYDNTLGLIKLYPSDTGLNYSTNQVYASLTAYKLQRDKGKAINIFA